MTISSFFKPEKITADGSPLGDYGLYTSKVVCVGRNYSAHAAELNNPVPQTPMLFIKPASSLTELQGQLEIPLDQGECQHEVEIALLIQNKLKKADENSCLQAVAGVGLALDLTLRQLQSKLKAKGHPWEKAKAFDGACPVSGFVASETLSLSEESSIEFSLKKNEKIVQQGNSDAMIFNISRLLSEISQHFTLYPGDIVLTGTPEGVGELQVGDRLLLQLNGNSIATAEIMKNHAS